MLCKYIAIGRLTKDIVQKETSGRKYGVFTLATDIGFGEHTHTNFVTFTVNEDRMNNMLKAKVAKGSLIHADGVPKVKNEKGEDGTYKTSLIVSLTDWGYTGSGKKDNSEGKPKAETAPVAPPANNDFLEIEDDDLPF